MLSKTFEEFWQVFLQVTFHEENPEKWTRREEKARWIEACMKLSEGASIADLGCGDGILDICLSRRGFKVFAVDRSQAIIDHGRSEDDTKKVNFKVSELTEIKFPEMSLDGVIIHETIGLMSRRDDSNLLAKAFSWLKPGGRVLTDCPVSPSEKSDWSKPLRDGTVMAMTSFDSATRLHRLNFEFHPTSGAPFNLVDPQSNHHHHGPGISRVIYSQEELTTMMQEAGFVVHQVSHYYGDSYFGLIGEKC